jgi:hypothetical protein
MQNLSHHLLGCGRVDALRSLLGEPSWLEAKLLAYGTAPVVADFRKWVCLWCGWEYVWTDGVVWGQGGGGRGEW